MAFDQYNACLKNEYVSAFGVSDNEAMSCQVCQSPEAEQHFGGTSCRACAAFFRRYYLSKKKFIFCTCPKRKDNSHPCRHCRILKCLAVGMSSSKLQSARDGSKGTILSTYPPSLSLMNCQLIPRDSPNISSTISKWPSYEQKRVELYGGKFEQLNIYGVTSYIKRDSDLMWQLVSAVFPQIDKLHERDKNSLLANFVPKWWQLEPSIDLTTNEELWEEKGKHLESMISTFYSSPPSENGASTSSEDLFTIFEPFWAYYYSHVIAPIAKRKFDKAEYMALFLLLLFDRAYTNISEECATLCEHIRKVILRELRGYQKSKDCDDARFLETVDTLWIIEKGEKKFQEEMLICEMHNVHIHDDFRNMIREQKL